MQVRRTILLVLSVAVVATRFSRPERIQAAGYDGYRSVTLASGRLGEIDVSNTFPDSLAPGASGPFWQSVQKTKGSSDLYVQTNVWAPGGSTGWHSHPGHSLIIVTAGTLSDYEGHDPGCKPHVYRTGMGFVDPGGQHVHNVRNEGSIEARTIAVQVIPAGAARRIDVARPMSCSF